MSTLVPCAFCTDGWGDKQLTPSFSAPGKVCLLQACLGCLLNSDPLRVAGGVPLGCFLHCIADFQIYEGLI